MNIDASVSNSAGWLIIITRRMYDVDGNGVIDQDEMTKIVQSIYDMLGNGDCKPSDTAEKRTKYIFKRFILN